MTQRTAGAQAPLRRKQALLVQLLVRPVVLCCSFYRSRQTLVPTRSALALCSARWEPATRRRQQEILVSPTGFWSARHTRGPSRQWPNLKRHTPGPRRAEFEQRVTRQSLAEPLEAVTQVPQDLLAFALPYPSGRTVPSPP